MMTETIPMTVLTQDSLVVKHNSTIQKHFPDIIPPLQTGEPTTTQSLYPSLRQKILDMILKDGDLQTRFQQVTGSRIDAANLEEMNPNAELNLIDIVLGIIQSQDQTDAFLEEIDSESQK